MDIGQSVEENLAKKAKKDGQHGSLFAPLKDSRDIPKYSDIKKHIFNLLRAEQYQQLQQDLLSYGLDQQCIADFFYKEGYSILNWAVVAFPSAQPLHFLYNNVPTNVLQEILEKNNYYILNAFFLGQSYSEKMGYYDQNTKKQQIEKFEVMLEIDSDGIKNYVSQNVGKECMMPELTANFASALERYSNKCSMTM